MILEILNGIVKTVLLWNQTTNKTVNTLPSLFHQRCHRRYQNVFCGKMSPFLVDTSRRCNDFQNKSKTHK